MCGIAGIISNDPVQLKEKICLSMIEAISHRGPDGNGVMVDGKVGFAHARLAIVDLSTSASQPMRSTSSGNSIIFNGEIYNYKDIRKDLIARGIKFNSFSDTEVLLAAYDFWGPAFVEKLNGIFAFAINDVRQQRVLLGRDRMGIKPLYWKSNSRHIIFGSEIKALTASSYANLTVNQKSLIEYLTFQNNFENRTLFENIEVFPTGTIAIIDLERLQIRAKKYWQASFRSSAADSTTLHANLEKILDGAVRLQLEADVPVNSFLSGGIDSAAIASLATKYSGRIKTFTCGFFVNDATEIEKQFDERSRAELVAANIHSEHHEAVLGPDDFVKNLDTWAWHAEEPRVGSNFPNFCISRLASKFTKVCFSGTGGDELFAGYPWRYEVALKENEWDSFTEEYFKYWNRMLPPQSLHMLVGVGHKEAYDHPREVFSTLLGSARQRVHKESTAQFLNAALIFEMETFLHGLLLSEDKASMAHGLEVRTPLLDNSIVDFALTVPAELKLSFPREYSTKSYGSGGSEMPKFSNGKVILRNVLSTHVPDTISNGRKQGFSPPFDTWFRKDFKSWIESEVLGKSSLLRDHIDINIAKKLWQEHLSGQKNHRLFVWGIIALYLCTTSFMRRTNE